MKGAEADGGNIIETGRVVILVILSNYHTKVLVGSREINQSSALSRSSSPPELVSIPIFNT